MSQETLNALLLWIQFFLMILAIVAIISFTWFVAWSAIFYPVAKKSKLDMQLNEQRSELLRIEVNKTEASKELLDAQRKASKASEELANTIKEKDALQATINRYKERSPRIVAAIEKEEQGKLKAAAEEEVNTQPDEADEDSSSGTASVETEEDAPVKNVTPKNRRRRK